MKYLVAEHRDGATGEEQWAVAGTPVVPNFPTGPQNTFLGLLDFKDVPYARVVELTKVSIDELAGILKKQYPGLPAGLCDAYVTRTASVAAQLAIATICQIYTTEDSARIKLVGKDEFYTLWTQQPIPAGYN